jgi:hypothetical protein
MLKRMLCSVKCSYQYAKANRQDEVLMPATSSRYVELQVALEVWDRLSL